MNPGFLFVAGLAVSLLAPPSAATERTYDLSSGPYCGISCLYLASKSLDKPISFAGLLQQRYVGSYKGSTVEELKLAAADHGLTATSLSGLSPLFLQSCRYPVLLHVRRPGLQMPYSHWVLYTGESEGKARLIDPPYAVELYDFADLAALWDGIGIVISDGPPELIETKTTVWLTMFLWLISIVLCLLPVRLAAYRYPAVPTVVWVATIGLVAGLHGVGYHALIPEGFYANPQARAIVAMQHNIPEIPIVTTEQMKEFVNDPGVVILDCRFADAFEYGHIPGAVHFSVDSRLNDRRAMAERLQGAKHVIVYCQSEGCKWSDSIGADLYMRGVRPLSIYRGGMNEWWQANAK